MLKIGPCGEQFHEIPYSQSITRSLDTAGSRRKGDLQIPTWNAWVSQIIHCERCCDLSAAAKVGTGISSKAARFMRDMNQGYLGLGPRIS